MSDTIHFWQPSQKFTFLKHLQNFVFCKYRLLKVSFIDMNEREKLYWKTGQKITQEILKSPHTSARFIMLCKQMWTQCSFEFSAAWKPDIHLAIIKTPATGLMQLKLPTPATGLKLRYLMSNIIKWYLIYVPIWWPINYV